MAGLAWQPSFVDVAAPTFDREFRGTERRDLGDGAWVEVTPQWLTGAAHVFEEVLDSAPWAEHERPMYERMVVEPRLTTHRWDDAPPLFGEMAQALGERFDRELDIVSANLYRDGRDSVAWHGDRVGRERADTVVAIVSLGSARRFLLRPTGGGTSLRFMPRPGDLLVLGGTIQRTWQHSVPKVARAGPRISVMFREEY
jgi:alkylated DNA repair dioxygenase AlkB